MKPFCEIIVAKILPAMRAIITKELMQRYGLNQTEVAQKLGITQPAISQYKRELRGYRVKLLLSNKEVMNSIKKLTANIALEDIKSRQIPEKFCEICEKIRREKIICQMHEGVYPSIAPCDFCFRQTFSQPCMQSQRAQK